MDESRIMRIGAICIAAMLLAGCHPRRNASMLPPPAVYAHFKDRLAAQLDLWGFKTQIPCSGIDLEHKDPISWEEQCFRFEKPQRMTGLWRNTFEAPTFCPSPAKQCPDASSSDPHRPIYGNMDIPSAPSGWKDTMPGGLYAVEFFGRRSEYPLFGGTSEADKQVIVYRWISVRQVEAPPPPPTKAEIEAWEKACHANHTCVDVKGLNGPKPKTN